MKKSQTGFFLVFLLIIGLVSCSKPSLQQDAVKYLIDESIKKDGLNCAMGWGDADKDDNPDYIFACRPGRNELKYYISSITIYVGYANIDNEWVRENGGGTVFLTTPNHGVWMSTASACRECVIRLKLGAPEKEVYECIRSLWIRYDRSEERPF